MLLDPVDVRPRPAGGQHHRARARSRTRASDLAPELFQSLLEVQTPVCRTTAEADSELRRLRARVTEHARLLGLRVGSAGTHPFSLFERQRITRRDRYNALVEQLQYIARRELIFGLHVHVAVDDADKAIAMMGALDRPPRPSSSRSPPARRSGVGCRPGSRRAARPSSPRFHARGRRRSFRQLRRVRRGGRPAGGDRLHRRVHAHLVGRPAASALRDDRDPRDGRGQPGGRRPRDRRVHPGARQALLRAVRSRREGSRRTTALLDEREQVARRPLRARGPADRPCSPAAGSASPLPSSSAGRSARSSPTRASSARSASSRASNGS